MSENKTAIKAKIVNRRGLHARAAARFAKMAGGFSAAITVKHGALAASGDSILELLMLGASAGEEIVLDGEGEERDAALAALAALVASGFEEKE